MTMFCLSLVRFSLKDELILISKLKTMVSMDSGNGHFSAMFGVPTLTLWGTTHPAAGFKPFAQPDTNSFIPDLDKISSHSFIYFWKQND